MFKNIISTFSTRILVMLFSFFLLVLTTQYLGADGRGAVSLLVAFIGILVLFNGFIGGSSLVYLIPKYKGKSFLKKVSGISVFWAIFVCINGVLVISFLGLAPKSLIIHILFLGLLASTYSITSLILLSYEKISLYNIANLIQVILNFSLFGFIIFITKSATVSSFILVLYISYIVSIFFIAVAFLKILNISKETEEKASYSEITKKMSKIGFVSQLGNFIQYLNYRFSYFVLSFYGGLASVGIYSVGVMISEAVWAVAGSIALVQYSRIANIGDGKYSKELTVKLAKFSFFITLVCVLFLMIIPENFISFIFGKEFSNVHGVIMLMSVGILSFGFSVILSHYFAGIGKYHINTAAAFLGLIVTVTGNLMLVPKIGYTGAAITASASYLVTSIFLLFIFLFNTKTPISSFRITVDDFYVVFGKITGVKSKNL